MRACWLLLFLLPLLTLGGCTLSLISPYDALTEQAIHQAAEKAETIFATVTVDQASYPATADAYRSLEGQLAVIATRASLPGSKNATEQNTVQAIRDDLAVLVKYHKEVGPYRESRLVGTRSLWRSLIHHEKGKKAATAATVEGGGR